MTREILPVIFKIVDSRRSGSIKEISYIILKITHTEGTNKLNQGNWKEQNDFLSCILSFLEIGHDKISSTVFFIEYKFI